MTTPKSVTMRAATLSTKRQKVSMSERPYDIERQMAEKLVQKLGFAAVADDYFLCAHNIADALSKNGKFVPFMRLRAAAASAGSEDEQNQKYREMIRLFDGLP